MSKCTVTFVDWREISTSFEATDSYQIRKDRPLVWLQRLLCWGLNKLRAYRVGETVEYRRIEFDTDDFMERLFKQREVVERFNVRPAQLLIGGEDFEKLMRQSVDRQYFTFTAEYGHSRKMLGLTVKVIPWMRGILVVP